MRRQLLISLGVLPALLLSIPVCAETPAERWERADHCIGNAALWTGLAARPNTYAALTGWSTLPTPTLYPNAKLIRTRLKHALRVRMVNAASLRATLLAPVHSGNACSPTPTATNRREGRCCCSYTKLRRIEISSTMTQRCFSS